MRFTKNIGGMCVAACLALNAGTHAGTIVWKPTRAQAVEAARNSGRLVLLLAGRATCSNCQYMKGTVCESPAVRSVVDKNYVCWYCPVDTSTEWYSYANGLGSFTLPLLCVIDPGNATVHLDRSTATQTPSVFTGRLTSHLPSKEVVVSLLRGRTSRLHWETESQLQYRVLKSQNLRTWTFVGGILRGTGAPADIEDSSAANCCFYRVMGFK